jgi:hypothetical protein
VPHEGANDDEHHPEDEAPQSRIQNHPPHVPRFATLNLGFRLQAEACRGESRSKTKSIITAFVVRPVFRAEVPAVPLVSQRLLRSH